MILFLSRVFNVSMRIIHGCLGRVAAATFTFVYSTTLHFTDKLPRCRPLPTIYGVAKVRSKKRKRKKNGMFFLNGKKLPEINQKL